MLLRRRGMARSWPRLLRLLRPLRLPRRTARLRLTVLYGGLFLACGAALLAVTYALVQRAIVDPPPPALSAQNHNGVKIQIPPGLILVPPGNAGDRGAKWLHGLEMALASEIAHSDLRQVLLQAPIALAIVTVVALALGWLVAGRVLRPLGEITAAARRISVSSLNERLSLRGPDDELKALGDTLDDLFARLEAAFEAQRHFVANASHELRTPVARERAMLQVALDDPGTTTETWRSTTREVLASNAEQEDLIEALLILASSESGLEHREPVDLAAIASKVLQAPRPEIPRLGLRVEAATRPAALDGDPLLAERLVANLIGNALRHNVPGGHVQVATATSHGRAAFSVTNTGPVIAPAEVDRLFRPFHHQGGRRAHNGHGLGLSIVRAIATAHGAAIDARARPEGGLHIQVSFPAGRSSPTRPSAARPMTSAECSYPTE
jgi:signal transduction histidine kinase